MDLKIEGLKSDKTSDELIGQMLADIFTGFKTKMVQPVLEENYKISSQLKELMTQEQLEMTELKEKIAELDARIQQVPLVILSSFRDAISLAGRETQDDRE
ncbi:hypothetical protein L9W92_14260 [Pelotomaculum terephthalicicum JT]|uniref:hypothetical protein n=1 Tax=Pelotomaculum TaxID=191373 RepID=UPI0009D23E99|nr:MULTISPECIES: hypothetical protein [Pelotomaculum]MCG9969188.1 hypothetical protein [Pelotomaculum terephthalicicum JT]OPX89948.1 MAG: hypothetical protein A4E54_00782 [Pelotomaculum sp. PtaB.Bin117]OPY62184.1 MAG: hypothetical protein A4E56_01529 [Pelotomaculum sp. PtaU1.Bin065]